MKFPPALFLAVCLAVARPAFAAESPQKNAPGAAPAIGVYRWVNGTANVDAFSRWLGQPVVWGEDFAGSESWGNVGWPVFWLKAWGPWVAQKPGRRLIFGVPILPGPVDGSGPKDGEGAGVPVSLEKGAAGDYNFHFRQLAENLVSHGLGNAILRPGWEFNGGWYTWRASGREALFAEYWRQIVRTMRAVPGAEKLQFCWNPTLGYQQFPAEKVWPGDEWVDLVGVDVYDETWQPETYPWPAGAAAAEIAARQKKVWAEVILGGDHGLAFWSRFAREHGKPLAIPEWGVNEREDRHGGLDNPYFVEGMHRFVTDPANHVAFHCYFDVAAPDGNHQLSPGEKGTFRTRFPQAAARFRALFGEHPTSTTH